ncbi:MAG: tRNA (adenosine(37)-N6)-dimethylallyltransferase MiaA [Hyphomicrobiales bacterium]|nr:tRNA (adenosine(37)-N6)-dimethylallyltransferase MiaA [Hyphomicrobiales bacterium]MDE2115893.1 tRNA (adenosine(37)-N6)-dimethylallyltransferase MiaA [Hyphomicrobiales bacterium]
MNMRAILIAGPTASGKSSLGLALAQKHHGTIINADSMQVYRDLRILSARPSMDEESLVPHLLQGHVDGAVNYSVGQWLQDFETAFSEVLKLGRLPIVVGGTGMYFKALTQGLSEIPAISDEVRARVRHEGEGVDPADLHARLARLDPVMAARLRPTDPQRILRALEVFTQTGRSLASFQAQKRPPMLDLGACQAMFLSPAREVLAQNINQRFDAMVAHGALAEVTQLAGRGLDDKLPVMRALGVPQFMAHLRGEIDLPAAIERAKADTRAYARRQFTFARHQLPGFVPFSP